MSYNMDRILDYAVSLTLELLAIPSVAGDCVEAIQRVSHEFEALGLPSPSVTYMAGTIRSPG